MGEIVDKRNYDELNKSLMLTRNTVYKEYLDYLSYYTLVFPNELLVDEDPGRCIRMFQLKQLTCKKNEDVFQKLSTVYNSASSLGCSVFLVIDSIGIDEKVNIYMGVRAPNYIGDDLETVLSTSYRALKEGFISNFPGSRYTNVSASSKIPSLLNDIFRDKVNTISSVSCVASIRDKNKTEKKDFVQGIEKLIDAMHGKPYTALFIAEPIGPQSMTEMRLGYQNIYSSLSSFKKSTWTYNEGESSSVMNSMSHGISQTITEGVTHTKSHTLAQTRGTADTININANIGVNSSKSAEMGKNSSINSPTKKSKAGELIKGVSGIAASIPVSAISIPGVGAVLGVVKAAGLVGGIAGSLMQGSTATEGIAESIGKSLGVNAEIGGGYSHAVNESETVTDGSTDSDSLNKSDGRVDTTTEGTTNTTQSGKALQVELINKNIEEILKRIDEQLQRTQECEDYGAYSCGAYFLSSKRENSLLAANTYKALMMGEGTSIERGAVNTWNDEDIVVSMKEYLRRFAHPIFAMPIDEQNEGVYITQTPGTIVSGLELPLHLGLPVKSVIGLPVLDHAEFGRNICESLYAFNVGKLYHMGQIEKEIDVVVDINSLTKHTFITGSTGSGKSNTIYKLLENAESKNISYLVVEPAKGEYKDIIGKRKGVVVFGTNPNIENIRMLRLNPFRFPAHIHILEHLDRLVEIFNVCWPMYAAMPAILKDAIERSYIMAGWDLEKSTNKYDEKIFPTFTDVVRQIRIVLGQSDYSAENKGDYIGSLVTRLKSLTNGINGLVFTTDDLSDCELFDQKAIVDLSRVGASETKSLIMGILVLKLQEHRMEERALGANLNDELKHITVLEEAHNLLKRVSTQQTSDSSNMQGKAVEMLANSIAEMRSYGEGFIIADQAPGLLDMSVIRNTNTKIILRLPDFSDRELVGKASGLNDDQIIELSKLETGVAAISQNDWLEPVLCKVDAYVDDAVMSEDSKNYQSISVNSDIVGKRLLDNIMHENILLKGEKGDIIKLKEQILRSKLDTSVKCDFMNYINASDDIQTSALRTLVYDYFKADQAIEKSKEISDITEWVKSVKENLIPNLTNYSHWQIDRIMNLIVQEQSLRDPGYNDILCRFKELIVDLGGTC